MYWVKGTLPFTRTVKGSVPFIPPNRAYSRPNRPLRHAIPHRHQLARPLRRELGEALRACDCPLRAFSPLAAAPAFGVALLHPPALHSAQLPHAFRIRIAVPDARTASHRGDHIPVRAIEVDIVPGDRRVETGTLIARICGAASIVR